MEYNKKRRTREDVIDLKIREAVDDKTSCVVEIVEVLSLIAIFLRTHLEKASDISKGKEVRTDILKTKVKK